MVVSLNLDLIEIPLYYVRNDKQSDHNGEWYVMCKSL